MGCAPILIITLCRYEHLKRCMESLIRNPLAKNTEVYIGLDYPCKTEHEKGYQKIKDFLHSGINGFEQVHIVEHKHNIGANENFKYIRDMIYEKYDRFIYTEDDNEFSPNFLEYMNRAMDLYRDDPNIFAISGYSYPVNTNHEDYNAYKLSFYFSAFGYGIWKWKELEARKSINLENMLKLYYNKRKMSNLYNVSKNQYCNFVKGMLEYTGDLIDNGEVKQIDLAYGLYLFAKEKYMIFPTVSKVKNWGFDGTGMNCGIQNQARICNNTYRTYQYDMQSIDAAMKFNEIKIGNETFTKDIQQRLDCFFDTNCIERIRTKLAYYVSIIIGREKMVQILQNIGKKKIE